MWPKRPQNVRNERGSRRAEGLRDLCPSRYRWSCPIKEELWETHPRRIAKR